MEVALGIVVTIFLATILVIPCVLVCAIWVEALTPIMIKILWTDLIVMVVSGFLANMLSEI